jgi:hypothetical protein
MTKEEARIAANKSFRAAMRNLPTGGKFGFVVIKCKTGCEIYIPSRQESDEGLMKEKEAYNTLVKYAEY